MILVCSVCGNSHKGLDNPEWEEKDCPQIQLLEAIKWLGKKVDELEEQIFELNEHYSKIQ